MYSCTEKPSARYKIKRKLSHFAAVNYSSALPPQVIAACEPEDSVFEQWEGKAVGLKVLISGVVVDYTS